MNGIIVVNKPKGYTSRDVVNILSKKFNTKKVGHTGTLDPIATGVLVICFGKYTKLVDLITSYDKTYIATVQLGLLTDTLDTTGKIIEENYKKITKKELEKSLNSFNKTYDQTVPIYSAVKINGKKLYEYAREGKDIELPKRSITVHDINLLDYNNKTTFTFSAEVSKGTYIRSLIDDVCKNLCTIGVMKDLKRTKQGQFDISNSYTLEDIKNNNYKILSVEESVDLKIIKLDEKMYKKVKNGVKIEEKNYNGLVLFKYLDKEIAIYEFNNNLGKMKVYLENE